MENSLIIRNSQSTCVLFVIVSDNKTKNVAYVFVTDEAKQISHESREFHELRLFRSGKEKLTADAENPER